MGVLALVILGAYGCNQSASKGNQGAGGGQQRRQSLSVETATVQRISIERHVELSGTLVSPDQARVSSEVAGIVRDVLIEIGQEVAAGQELVRLDTTELELALQRAESALRQTEVQLGIDSSRPKQTSSDENVSAIRTAAANRDDARAQLARAQELVSKGLLSKAELDTTETRVKVTEAAYQAAVENVQSLRASLQDRQASYDMAKKKLNDAVIRAPLAGSIGTNRTARRIHSREHDCRDHCPDEPPQVENRGPGKVRQHDPSESNRGLQSRTVPGRYVSRKDRLHQSCNRPGHANICRGNPGGQSDAPIEARVLCQRSDFGGPG